MRVFHDSRNTAYRTPYGAVAPKTPVTLRIDVSDAPGAVVSLRTWTDDEGERFYEMRPSPRADAAEERDGAGCVSQNGEPTRYEAGIIPQGEGVVWYQFAISDETGATKRYGATPGHRGGTGQLADWEPPSFQLTVHEPRDMPPTWYEPIGGYLFDPGADHDLAEIVRTLLENYPAGAYDHAFPWHVGQPAADSEQAQNAATAGWAESPIAMEQTGWTALDVRDDFPCFGVGDEVFGFWRRDDAGNPLCVLVNASTSTAHEVEVPFAGEEVSELIGGYAVPATVTAANGATAPHAHIHLGTLGTAALHFHAHERLQKPLESGLGVLAHITSLPTGSAPDGKTQGAMAPAAPARGTLGAPARDFVEGLAQANIRYWQVLPVNPTDEFGSPYAGISAFAGNIRLLEGGFANAGDDDSLAAALERLAGDTAGRSGAGAKRSGKNAKRSKAAAAGAAGAADDSAYRSFCEHEREWLEPYAAFMAIRQKVGAGIPWQEWPDPYRRYDAELVARDDELEAFAEAWKRAQFAFQRQWDDLRTCAREQGVALIGDMPIYVSADSADVWAHPEIFQLDSDGMPRVVAGCPPDAFAVDGQIWGNPIYDWDACEASGYDWWMRRLKRAFDLYDYVRLDHFIGFSRYYAIPAGCDASDGAFHKGPGFAFFKRAYDEFGPLPVIAEDLGLITPAVRALSSDCGFPGMDIMQFVDGNDPLSGYNPRPEKIVYTGTHDNQTIVGYCENRYPHLDGDEAASRLMELAVSCPAPVCVIPLQDLMLLGDEARMNVPGVAEGNWAWHADPRDMPQALERAKALAELKGQIRA